MTCGQLWSPMLPRFRELEKEMNTNDKQDKKTPVIIELSPQQLEKVTGGLSVTDLPILRVGPALLPNPSIRFHRCPTPPNIGTLLVR
jgi:hypothetical protein